jgi:hypothetical protein
MYVRLGFSVAASVDPDILFIDEALSVGDEHFRGKCINRLNEFRERGKTILFVSHDMGAVKSMCQWVVLMDKGEVLEQGTAEQVADAYLKRAQGARQRAHVGGQPRHQRVPALGLGRDRGHRGRALGRESKVRARVHHRRAVPRADRAGARTRTRHCPVFGLGLYRSDGTYVNGSNHHWRDRPIELARRQGRREGVVEMAVDGLPLLQGQYYLTTFLYDHSKAAPTAIDHREHVPARSRCSTPRHLQHGMLFMHSPLERQRSRPSGRVAESTRVNPRRERRALPFDQYQRYRLVADLLTRLAEERSPCEVLDVGGRTALLRGFLPKDAGRPWWTSSPPPRPGSCSGTAARLPFRDDAFDAVCGLRHAGARASAVARGLRGRMRPGEPRLRGCSPVRTTPSASAEAEKLLQKFLKDKLQLEHRYLHEHRHNGLPSARAPSASSRAGRGWWRATVTPTSSAGSCSCACRCTWTTTRRCADSPPGCTSSTTASLYDSDHAEPVYRHVVVAAIGAARLPKVDELLDAPVAPAGALRQTFDMLGQLVHFDRERTWWLSVRGELERVIASYKEQGDAWQKGAELSKEQLAKAQERYEQIFAAYQSSESGRKWAVGQLEATQAALAAAKAGTGIDELRAELEQARLARAQADKELAETRGKLRGAEELLAQRELVYDEQQRELSSRWKSLVRFFTGGR